MVLGGFLRLSHLSANIYKYRKFRCFFSSFSVPFTGSAVFFVGWLILLFCSSAYCLFIFQSLMYLVGMCLYVTAMVNDLAAVLGVLDESLRAQSVTQKAVREKIQQALAYQIRFHNGIIEYAIHLASSTDSHHNFYIFTPQSPNFYTDLIISIPLSRLAPYPHSGCSA